MDINWTVVFRGVLTVMFFGLLFFIPLGYKILRKVIKLLDLILSEEKRRNNYLLDQKAKLEEELDHYKELVKK